MLGKTIFDAVPNVSNTFWINSKRNSFDFINFEAKNLFNEDLSQEKYHNLINQFDLVCFHFLDTKYYQLLKTKKIQIPTFWIGWGGDYYWLIDTLKDFEIYLPKTKKWAQNSAYNLIDFLVKDLKKLKRKKNATILNQLDYFAPALSSEYDLIKSNYKKFKPELVHFNYGYLNNQVIQQLEKLHVAGEKILIGNSATPTNNHLDVLDDLKGILQEEKLIFPLNYGKDDYKKMLMHFIHNNFEKAEILKEFVPNDDFNRILMQCQNVIMGNKRQQALATILLSLYMGANVFLYEKSVNYAFLKKEKFHLYTIEQLKKNSSLLKSKLTENQIIANREKINHLWSIQRNVDVLNQLISTLK